MSSNVDTKLPNNYFMVDSENISGNDMIRQCFDAFGVFVIAINIRGEIIFVNATAEEVLGCSQSEITGKDFIYNFIIKDKQSQTKKLIDKISEGNSFPQTEIKIHIQGANNEQKIIESKNVPIVDRKKNMLGMLISGNDITNHLKREKELHLDLNLYRLLANNIPDINLFLFDKNLQFILAEGNEMKNNDFNRDYFENRTLDQLPDKELIKLWEPCFKSALKGKEIASEFQYNNYHYYIWVLPIYNKENEIEAGVAITQNITDDKQIERKLRKSKEEAERANKSKTDFLARVSHEIRTPLNAILGFTEQLKHSSLNESQKEYANIIEKSSEHLLSLINDILVLSKIEARQLKFETSPFKLKNTIKYLHNTLLIRSNEKNLKFTYYFDEKLDRVLLGDPFRLRQILLNLLGNAIKFTNTGSVKLKCVLDEETDTDVAVKFEVTDTGIGISKENLKIIFERFKQADSSITKRYGGTGLGLAICKNLIELQGGGLSVESQESLGSTFTFTITYKKGTLNDIVPEEKNTINSETLKGKKVLLVDDDHFNRLLAKIMLDKFSCKTTIANNGTQAISYLDKHKFDIVLLDIHMSDYSGIEVAEFVRKKRKDKVTKILAVTAAVMKDDIHSYFRAGINDFLIKPFKEFSLYDKMQNILGLDLKPQNELNSQTIVMENNDSERYNLTELKKMTGNSTSFINTMLRTFIDNSENAILLFQEGLKDENWEQIGEVAHKLLPSYRHLDVKSIVSMLLEIKTNCIVEYNYSVVPELVENMIIEMEKLLVEIRKEMR